MKLIILRNGRAPIEIQDRFLGLWWNLNGNELLRLVRANIVGAR